MKRFSFSLVHVLALLLLAPGLALAQTGTVQGTVVDPDEVPVPGANIILEGTSVGTATDTEGNFSFTAPAGEHTLVVTFVGYEDYSAPITVTQNETLELEVQLQEGALDLDEVVVTALGIEREERSIGYAVQEVEPEAIERSNESNLVSALAGKVAGVQVTGSSGQPGASSRIVIRGNSSFGDNQPLFVVDGIPISNAEDDNPEGATVFTGGTSNRALDIDPNIIEDVTVLKGASAMALYGSRAANGAVLITTKGGEGIQQDLEVTVNTKARWDDAVIDGFQNQYALGTRGCFESGEPRDRGGFMDEECWVERVPGVTEENVGTLSPQGVTSWGPSIDSLNNNPELLERLGVERIEQFDPREDFYRTGGVMENNVSISGGAPGGSFFLSGSYLDQGGIVPGTELGRASVMGKYTASLTDKFSAQTSLNYTRTDNRWVNEGNGFRSYLYGLNFTPVNYNLEDSQYEDESQRVFHSAFNNPYWLVENNYYTSDVDRYIGNVMLTYDILPWLSLRERVGIDSYTDTRKGRVDVGTRSRPDGSLYDQTIGSRQINSDLILQGRRDVGAVGIDALAGFNYNYRYYQYNYLRGQDLGVPDFFNIGNASQVTGDEYREEQALMGLYTQATLDYDDWVYLTLTGRNDWSSTLPADNRSYFYPSASLGFVFTEATDLFSDTPLSFGKLRGSLARIGNDAPVYSIGTPFVQANPGDGVRGNIDFPFQGVNAYQLTSALGNPEVEPELSTEYEVGTDLRFFGQRGRVDVSYYNRRTTGQIFEVPISGATGFSSRLLNAGDVRNRGWEVALSLRPIETSDFAWDIDANWSKNTTEIVELAEGVENIFLAGFTQPQIRAQEGEGGYGVIWGSRFQRADAEEFPEVFENNPDLLENNPELEEGDLLIDSETGLPIPSGTLGAIGNVQPDWLANLRSTFSFRGFSVSALLDVRQGGDVLNMDQYYTAYYGTAEVTADRGSEYVYDGFAVDVQEDGSYQGVGRNETEIVRDQDFYQGFYSLYDENLVEDGSYLKLREVALSYTIPARYTRSIVGLEGATITAAGRNLWIRSDFSYRDPEGSLVGSGNGQGFYHGVTPGSRSYSLGLRLTL